MTYTFAAGYKDVGRFKDIDSIRRLLSRTKVPLSSQDLMLAEDDYMDPVYSILSKKLGSPRDDDSLKGIRKRLE